MSCIEQVRFTPSAAIEVLSLEEIDAVAGANTAHDIANVVMATGAAGAGVGVVFGQPEIVAAGAVIAGVGGLIYLGASWYDQYYGS